MYISTVICNHNLYVYTYVNYINMTIYDNCKKELRAWENSDYEFMFSYITHTFIFGIGLFTLTILSDLSVTSGEKLILALGSSCMVLLTTASTMNLFFATIALLYTGVIDILKWIKHKWSEL